MKFHVSPSSGRCADFFGRTNVKNVIGAFRDYAKAPKGHFSHFGIQFVFFLSDSVVSCL